MQLIANIVGIFRFIFTHKGLKHHFTPYAMYLLRAPKLSAAPDPGH